MIPIPPKNSFYPFLLQKIQSNFGYLILSKCCRIKQNYPKKFELDIWSMTFVWHTWWCASQPDHLLHHADDAFQVLDACRHCVNNTNCCVIVGRRRLLLSRFGHQRRSSSSSVAAHQGSFQSVRNRDHWVHEFRFCGKWRKKLEKYGLIMDYGLMGCSRLVRFRSTETGVFGHKIETENRGYPF